MDSFDFIFQRLEKFEKELESLKEKEKMYNKIIFNMIMHNLNLKKSFYVHDYIDYLTLWNNDKNNFMILVNTPLFEKNFEFCKFLFFDLSFEDLKYFLELGTKYNFYEYLENKGEIENIIQHVRSKFFYEMIWNFVNYMYNDFPKDENSFLFQNKEEEENNFIIKNKEKILNKIYEIDKEFVFVYDENTHKFIKLLINDIKNYGCK